MDRFPGLAKGELREMVRDIAAWRVFRMKKRGIYGKNFHFVIDGKLGLRKCSLFISEFQRFPERLLPS